MTDQELVDSLLKQQESDILDYKSRQYNLDNEHTKSEFIKDIIAMANTPKNKSAYILVGIEEKSGKVSKTIGVTKHHDEGILGSIVASRTEPTPRFHYRHIVLSGMTVGLYEIPRDQPGLVMPSTDYGVLRRGCVYFRQNTNNTEAGPTDLVRLVRFADQAKGLSEQRAASSNSIGAWPHLYRACDGFNSQRTYIAVFDKDTNVDCSDWVALAHVHWSLIIDFDKGTDIDGNHAVAKYSFSQHHALQLSALDEEFELTRRSCLWVAATGLNSRPTTKPSNDWRSWNRTKVPMLESTMKVLSGITEPAPVTVVIFGGEANYVSTVCEIADRAFAERVDFVFANPNPAQYQEVARRFTGHSVTINLPQVCQGLREIQPEFVSSKEILFPKLNGGTITIAADRARWLEEHLELIHWMIGSNTDTQTNSVMFLKGASVSWSDLNINTVVIDRDITRHLERKIRNELDDRATRRVNLWHLPGAGATTVARNIGWNIHQVFPTVAVREVQPQGTAERLRHLFGVTKLPVLIIIDLPGITKDVVDRLYDELRDWHTPAVLFNVERRFNIGNALEQYYLDGMLSTREAVALSSVLAEHVPERETALDALIDERDHRKRNPFYFELTAFGRDFQGLQSYLDIRLSQASGPVRDVMLYLSFAYFYGQVDLPLQTFWPVLGTSASKRIVSSVVFPDYIRELLVESMV